MGGPIVKNKLFMFGSGEWLRVAQSAVTKQATLHTAAERGGRPVTILLHSDHRPADRPAVSRQHHPYNQIDLIAAQLMKLWPLPNLPNGQLEQFAPSPTHTYEYLLKVTTKSARPIGSLASLFNNHISSLAQFGRNGGGFNYVNVTGPQGVNNGGNINSIIVNDTHVFKPTLLNQLRWSYTRIRALKGQSAAVGPTEHDLDPTWPQFPAPVDRPSIWVKFKRFRVNGRVRNLRFG